MICVDINHRLIIEAVIKENDKNIVDGLVTDNQIGYYVSIANSFGIGYQYGLLMGGLMTYDDLRKMTKGIFTANVPMKLETLKNHVRTDFDRGDLLVFHSDFFDNLMLYFGLHCTRASMGIKQNQIFYLTREFLSEVVHPSPKVNQIGKDKERPFMLSDAWKALREYYAKDYLRNSDIAGIISSQIGSNTNQFNFK